MSDKENEVLVNENEIYKENEIPVSEDEPYFRNILGSELEDYNSDLPLISTPIEIEEGTKFISMPIAVHFIEQYARQKNFAIFKYKNETFPDGTSRKRVLKCDLGGRYKKLLRPALVTITTFNNEYNHNLYSETIKFTPMYKCFSQEIMEQIEFYVVHGHCDATMTRNLLQPKYPDRIFLCSDLTNAIQKIKWEKGLNQGDAAILLTKLLEYQKKDSEWFVKPLIDDTKQRQRWIKFYNVIIHDNTARTNKYNYSLSLFILIENYNKSRLAAQAFMQDERSESYEWLLQCCLEACEITPSTFVTDADPAMIAAVSTVFPRTHHMQCLFHLYQNIFKNLHSKLGSLFQEFLKDFKNIQHSHCESVFERCSESLVEKYSAGKKYITALLNRKNTWVKCFTSRHFTASIQSTQRAELENALIQKAVQSSFSFLQVQEVLENRHETEFINNSYSIWKTATLQYTQPFVIQTFFSEIDNLLKKYLTQLIHDVHYKQMCQSVCYRAFQIPMTEITISDDDSFEPFYEKENNNNSSEISIEADEDRELNLQSLITIVNPNEILEIWKISCYNYSKCY
ncbi:hypothetical protein Glove_167g114 [Diversispora epigaea]|uniref:MULE transposase domain-containing protein n=1 Tax=Diversispora epigaea TaxID=1348612 RepID=A0A397IQ74_9GLOM|nr:hypothetical protein Glove_167g114 [Diversispora epigaea]